MQKFLWRSVLNLIMMVESAPEDLLLILKNTANPVQSHHKPEPEHPVAYYKCPLITPT